MNSNDQVKGLLSMPAVEVSGEEYTGGYLASMVAVNSNQPEAEAARTPELTNGFGRVVAAAHRELEQAKLDYRIWRDGMSYTLTNNMQSAINAGFACAAEPPLDAKGNAKPPKLPAASAVDVYIRTLPEYREHWEKQNKAEEAWAVLHAALSAAESRIWAIREVTRDTYGDMPTTTKSSGNKPPPPPPRRG